MKRPTKLSALAVLLAATLLTACQKNDNNDNPLKIQYTIGPYQSSKISGTADFTEILHTDSVQLTIQLTGVSQDGSYPVLLRKGTSIENGEVAFNLGFVDGKNPTLSTSINLPFSELLKYNGCIDIYRNPNDTVTIVAQSEIGANNVFKSYDMANPITSQPNGQFRIYKRDAGAYVVVRIDSATAHIGGVPHPTRVYNAGGAREFELENLSEVSGVSATTVTDHTFDELTHADYLIKVLQSDELQDVVLSQGVIK